MTAGKCVLPRTFSLHPMVSFREDELYANITWFLLSRTGQTGHRIQWEIKFDYILLKLWISEIALSKFHKYWPC